MALTPEPVPTFSQEEVDDFVAFELSGLYPGVRSILRKFMDYACDNEAIAGRPMPACDQTR